MILYHLRLGQAGLRCDALHKIHAWAPKRARSYTIEKIERYEYGSFAIRRAYFRVHVTYYSRAEEGAYLLGKWSWEKYCLARKDNRFPVLRPRKKLNRWKTN